jgi:hypothetical protein
MALERRNHAGAQFNFEKLDGSLKSGRVVVLSLL